MKEQAHDSTHARRSPARAAVLLSALLVATLMVVSASRAPFTAATNNSANSVAAGTVTLSDDDSASALFTVTGMTPGQTEVRCILVSYTGTVVDPAPVKLYSGGYTDSGNFADYLKVTIEEGAGAVFGDCSEFASENILEPGATLSAFDASHADYATGAGAWDPASTPETKSYRITFQLDPSTPDGQQGESVSGLVFTWEVQS